jgi:putative membrane protein
VPGVSFTGDRRLLLVVALIVAVLNTCVKPVLIVLTLPFLLITLGLFTFLMNAFLLWMTSELSAAMGLGFHVEGFWAAFLGALVVSAVSMLLSMFVSQSDTHRASGKS